jgi:hypothetical protein
MKERIWVKETARDLIAFGSIPFLVLTAVRVSVCPIYYPMQFIISALIFFILRMFLKAELRAGLGFILLIFTSLFYADRLFTLFAMIVYAGLIAALFYLGKERKEIIKGLCLGAASAGCGYFIVRLIFLAQGNF